MPPVGGMDVYNESGRLLRRTLLHLNNLPLSWRRWLADCLSAEVALAEEAQKDEPI